MGCTHPTKRFPARLQERRNKNQFNIYFILYNYQHEQFIRQVVASQSHCGLAPRSAQVASGSLPGDPGRLVFPVLQPLERRDDGDAGGIDKERKRIAAAHEVDQARKALEVFKDRVPANSDPNELMEFVMARIRSSPLKLVDLKPDKPKSLGPYDCIALHLTLEGTYIQSTTC